MQVGNGSGIQQGEPMVLGDLNEDELQKLTLLRQRSEQIVHQIGLNRVAEQRLMQQLQQTERDAQLTLHQTGARLGIPDGTAWHVTGNGQAVLVPTAKPFQTPSAEG